ncbi:MAG: CapA family protein [Okeania sp. SIO3B5]|uniref:CapA family protein n=1 Tax=Okeania sp. SIO3B5 TaxID=2607811 RepID=UPI0013FF6A52|nr:CapA family protein [Okeania sp. SIO3B5]NEO55571.1 CapA family protein [Okeania sp. SIO3B5]
MIIWNDKFRNFEHNKLIRLIFLSGILFISSCNIYPETQTEKLPETLPVESPQPPQVTPYVTEAKLMAVGDIMMHGMQIKSGYNSQTKTYSYQGFFTEVKDILSAGDWVIGNLETTLAGPESGYTGYPLFNAPATLADAIKWAGFNILTTANNHSLDRREKGLLKTLENLRDREIYPVGTAASLAESQEILIVEKNEILMAFLAYTYGTNGIPIPQGKDYLVNLIDEQKIIQDITRAREKGADIVTVSLHFGAEYQRLPNTEQKQLVESLVNGGADIILGSHPHVVQPYKIFNVPSESGDTRQAVAIYSMGNFISNQTKKYTKLGVIFQVNIQKNFPEETIEISGVEALPTWVHRYRKNGKLNFRVLPLEEVVNTKNDSLLKSRDYLLLEKYLTQMNSHINSLNK